MIVENRNHKTCGTQANVAVSTEKTDRIMVYFNCFLKIHKRKTGGSFGDLQSLQGSLPVHVV